MPEEDYAALFRIADRLAPQVRRDFLEAVAKLQKRISLAAIARAVESGFPGELIQLASNFPDDLIAAVTVVNDVFLKAGAVAATQLGSRLEVAIRFDVYNPFSVDAAQASAAAMITNISENTEKAIRSIVVRSFTDGIPPREAARLIRPLIGLTESDALAVLNYRTKLIAAGGLTSDSVERIALRYADKLLRARSVAIARTETIRFATDGQLALWNQAQSARLLSMQALKKWIVTPDERLCPRCQALAGKTAPVSGGLFISGRTIVLGPPLHVRCRCALVIARI